MAVKVIVIVIVIVTVYDKVSERITGNREEAQEGAAGYGMGGIGIYAAHFPHHLPVLYKGHEPARDDLGPHPHSRHHPSHVGCLPHDSLPFNHDYPHCGTDGILVVVVSRHL